MSRLATLQIIWPPVQTLIFCTLMDWIASFGSMLVTALAFTLYTYVVFAPRRRAASARQ